MQQGLRRSAEPRKENAHQMIDFAKAMTEQEIREAAAYYGALRWTSWMRVVETDTVPKMASADGMWLPLAGNAREPIGNRLIETPTDPARTDLRDPHSGFTAYVPKGALEKGRRLVVTGGGKTRPCATCHGANLTGLGRVPGIASRSPSYLARQMYDIQSGARHGAQSVTWMKPVVARLSADDILNIAAYAASLPMPGK